MDVAILGSGSAAMESRGLLQQAGFEVGLSPAYDAYCPVILGDTPNLFSTALALVDAGRPVLLGAPQALSLQQIETLAAARKPKKALYFWSLRRFHPGYRLAGGLVQSDDPTWQPRYARQVTLGTERPTSNTLRWTAIESIGVLLGLLGATPGSVAGSGVANAARGCSDYLSLSLRFDDMVAYLEVGVGEGIERRETVIAAARRRAYVDELNHTVPVRLVDDEPTQVAGSAARWVSCPSPNPVELARQQCLAFLEATAQPALAEIEANLWNRTLATWQAAERALLTPNRAIEVGETLEAGLRVLQGGAQAVERPAPSLRVIFG